jgi:hypothetical protein
LEYCLYSLEDHFEDVEEDLKVLVAASAAAVVVVAANAQSWFLGCLSCLPDADWCVAMGAGLLDAT